jgi:hypothetical protein
VNVIIIIIIIIVNFSHRIFVFSKLMLEKLSEDVNVLHRIVVVLKVDMKLKNIE